MAFPASAAEMTRDRSLNAVHCQTENTVQLILNIFMTIVVVIKIFYYLSFFSSLLSSFSRHESIVSGWLERVYSLPKSYISRAAFRRSRCI